MKAKIEEQPGVATFQHCDLPSGAVIQTPYESRDGKMIVLRTFAGWVALDEPDSTWECVKNFTGTRLPVGTVIKLTVE